MSTRRPDTMRLRRGLAFPVSRVPEGYFASKGPLDTAWGNLMNALFTPIGSRPMARSFGSEIATILFEPDVAANETLLQSMIEDAASQWVPNVIIYGVHVSHDDESKIGFLIRFGLVGRSDEETRLVEIDKSRELIDLRAT